MKIRKLQVLVVCVICVVAFGKEEDIVTKVKCPMSRIVNSYGEKRLRPFLLLNDWDGFNIATNSDFIQLSQIVTNHWNEMLAEMPRISTNQAERIILMASGVVTGEEKFLSCVSLAADMVLSNKLTLAELKFYTMRCSIADHHAVSSLVRRYQEPAISNLIMKLYAVGKYPNGVSHIFSGQAKEDYLDAVNDGLIGP